MRSLLSTTVFFSLLMTALRSFSTDVSSFTLGTAGTFHDPAVRHGTYAFEQIRVIFDTDVYVDFYDLQLGAMAPAPYTIPLSGFSYDPSTYTAVWTVDGQPVIQNERYRAILSGVWDTSGTPLTNGSYTNEFTVLSGDVSGDDTVAPLDELLIINHINQSGGYDPALDVNANGAVTSLDALIVINILNSTNILYSLIAPGPYLSVSNTPPAQLQITDIQCAGKEVHLQFLGLPSGCRCTVEGQRVMTVTGPARRGFPITSQFVTGTNDPVSFLMTPGATNEFYRALFR